MAKDRIYFVANGDVKRLVRAPRIGPALMHVAKSTHTVRVATQNDLEVLLAAGVKVEASAETPPQNTSTT